MITRQHSHKAIKPVNWIKYDYYDITIVICFSDTKKTMPHIQNVQNLPRFNRLQKGGKKLMKNFNNKGQRADQHSTKIVARLPWKLTEFYCI